MRNGMFFFFMKNQQKELCCWKKMRQNTVSEEQRGKSQFQPTWRMFWKCRGCTLWRASSKINSAMESHFQDAETFWETDETKTVCNSFCKLPSAIGANMQKKLEKEKVTSKNVSTKKKGKQKIFCPPLLRDGGGWISCLLPSSNLLKHRKNDTFFFSRRREVQGKTGLGYAILGSISREEIWTLESTHFLEGCFYCRLKTKNTKTEKDNIPTVLQTKDAKANCDQWRHFD